MHPDREQLANYLSGDTPEDLADEIARHVAQCAECEQTIRDLEAGSDPLVSMLRYRQGVDKFEDEPACQRMASAIRSREQDTSPPTVDVAQQTGPILDQHPDVIRDYRLLSKLGQGGMGAVFRALHTKLDRVVAIKLLSPDRMRSPEAVLRFEREMKAVGKLNHPKIVAALDAGEADGMHYLVMEYIEGTNLAALVQHTGPLAVSDACELIRQAAVAMDHAWTKGLVHRDIKPSNLMLARADEGEACVKLLDLGLALLDDPRPDDRNLTTTGQFMGTVEYMAPEQASDSHTVDARADVYSLGATLFKLLTGRAPFQRDDHASPFTLMMAKVTNAAPTIGSFRSDLPEQLVTLVDRLLARDPATRFATPGQVADALAPFAKEADLSALLDSLNSGVPPTAGGPKARLHPDIDKTVGVDDAAEAGDRTGQAVTAGDGARSLEDGASAAVHRTTIRRMVVPVIVLAAVASVFLLQRAFLPPPRDQTSDSAATAGLPVADSATSHAVDAADPLAGSATTATNYALWFNGVDNFVEVPSLVIDVNRPFTMETRLKYAGNPATYWCLMTSLRGVEGPPGAVLARSHEPDWGFGIRNRTYQLTTDNNAPSAYHIAGVSDGSEMRLYINGRLVSQRSLILKDVSDPARHLVIGAERTLDESATYHHFLGLVDEVRISQVARYLHDFTPERRFDADGDTLALYHCDEGTGNVVHDASGNGHHGNLVGPVWQRLVNDSGQRMVEHDRRVVEWIQSVGGSAGVSATNHGYLVLGPDDPIPDAPLQLSVATLADLTDLNAEDFSLFDDLPWLGVLILSNSDVSDQHVSRIRRVPMLQNVYLWNNEITDAGLASLIKHCPNIRILHLTDTAVTNACIPGLADLKHLEDLVLVRCEITDDALPALYGHSSLQLLHLLDTQCTQSGLHKLQPQLPDCEIVSRFTGADRRVSEWIAELGGQVGLELEGQGYKVFPDSAATTRTRHRLILIGLDGNPHFKDDDLRLLSNLERLETLVLDSCRVTGAGFDALHDLPRLESLYLSHTRVTNDAITKLKRFPSLRSLHLNGTAVTDAGIPALAELAGLTDVGLVNCDVSDRSVAALGSMSNLKRLDVTGTGLTAAGIAQLRQALPNCSVVTAATPEVDSGDDTVRRTAEWVFEIGGQLAVTTVESGYLDVKRVEDIPPRRFELAGVAIAECDRLTPADFTRFSNHPKLIFLTFTGSPISGECLDRLGHLPKLELVYLWNTGLKDDDLAVLGRYPTIKVIHAHDTMITDASVSGLVGLKQLETLIVSRTRITDASVDSFKQMKQLKMLNLNGTSLSAQRIEELRAALPDCTIEAGP